jgi:hypothetical protein
MQAAAPRRTPREFEAVCTVCANPFRARGNRARYCSRACRNTARRPSNHYSRALTLLRCLVDADYDDAQLARSFPHLLLRLGEARAFVYPPRPS